MIGFNHTESRISCIENDLLVLWALTGALYFLSLTLLKVVKNFAKNSHENEFSLELQDMLMISK